MAKPKIRSDEEERERRRAYRLAHRTEIAEYNRSYREMHHEELLVKWRRHHADNRERRNQKSRDYNARHRDHLLGLCSEWRSENRDAWNAYRRRLAKKRRETDPIFRLKESLCGRINRVLKRGQGKRAGSAIKDLGCTLAELRSHIEAQFQSGMSWENWGIRGWHVDHIKPLASFDLTDREQFLKACHYTNLQPLWAADNIRKGAKLPPQQENNT